MNKSEVYFNPYRSNLRIMKGLLGRPFTLIVSIVMLLTSLLGGFITLLPTAAFFLIWIVSKSKNEFTSFTPSCVITIIYSVIGTAVAAFGAAICILIYFDPDFIINMNIFDAFAVMVCAVLYVIYIWSFNAMFKDFRKSVNGIYLVQKGSVALCVSSAVLLSALLIIMTTVAAAKFSLLPFGSATVENSFIFSLLCNNDFILILPFFISKLIGLIFVMIFSAVHCRRIRCVLKNFNDGVKNETQTKQDLNNKSNVSSNNIPDGGCIFEIPSQNGVNPYDSSNAVNKTLPCNGMPQTNQNNAFVPQNPFDNQK